MTKKEIYNGFTNKSFKKNDKFVQEIIKNKFNHNFKYDNLKNLKFVPKNFKQTNKKVIWEFIEGNEPKININNLIKIGKIMREIHLSDIKLPKNNLLARSKHYLKIINEKKNHIPEIHNNFIKMNKIMKNMGKLNPVHNDIWTKNLIEDYNGKIWIVDWEYATMGDRHFDIAYFIESSFLNEEQEKIFLHSYRNYKISNYEVCNPKILTKYKKLVNYMILLWIHSQDKIHFSDKIFKEAMHK